jgi:hypothetical protein
MFGLDGKQEHCARRSGCVGYGYLLRAIDGKRRGRTRKKIVS